MNNYYLTTQLAEAHRQDLLCEAEQHRRLSGLPTDPQGAMHRTAVIRATLVLTAVLVLVFFGSFLVHSIMGFGLHPTASHYNLQALSEHLATVYNHLYVAVVRLVA